MNKTAAALAAAAALAVAALAGCSSSSASAPPAAAPAPAATSAPAEPAADILAILKSTGATPDPGTAVGTYDVNGNRSVSGSYRDGETVSVQVSPDQAAYAASLAANGTGDDEHAIVTLPGKDVIIFATAGTIAGQEGVHWDATGAQLAARTGGTALAPGTAPSP